MEDKRLEQKRETWIKNLMKVQGVTREDAENLYIKIQPFSKVKVDINEHGKTVINKNGQIIGEQG